MASPSTASTSVPTPPPAGSRFTFMTLVMAIALLTAPVVALSRATVWVDGRVLAGVATALNLGVFILYAVDKRRAARGAFRIPEWVLHLGELLGGWPAAYLAQRLLRHKSSKFTYLLVFWLIVLLHQLVAVDVILGGQISGDAWLVVRHWFSR
ncbi:MAG: DUF1294 domain-containing protein [Opitutaceae bacterium]|nr:DUF1294 domain-containing protein [Opitutaceae bacterium]